jgi:putative photosynthetic complex assembly protein
VPRVLSAATASDDRERVLPEGRWRPIEPGAGGLVLHRSNQTSTQLIDTPMSDPFHRDPFPRKVLIAFGSLILFFLILVVVARLMGYNASQMPPSPTIASRAIRFIDQPDGSTLVVDAATNGTVSTLPPGGEGFIRGVLRATGRTRHLAKVSPEAPYRLDQLADGRLTLTDVGTGKVIELISFGHTNVAAFAAFLPNQGHTSAPAAPTALPESVPPQSTRVRP